MSFDEPSRDPTAVMGRRILAFVIDVLIIGLAVSIFVRPNFSVIDGVANCAEVVLGANERCFEPSNGNDVAVVDYNLYRAVMLQLGLWLLNAVLLQGVTGATVGKTLLGLRCVKADGDICGLGAAFVRTVALVVDYAFCFLIGLVTASVSKGHRRLGDMTAGTYVVRATSFRSLPADSPAPADAPPWWPNEN